MRRLLFAQIFLVTCGVAHGQSVSTPARDGGLPGISELRSRALESFQKSAAARERYICRERIENEDLDGSGRVKKTRVSERELFFVNGFQIAQPVSKDGKPLTSGELKKRDEEVKKAIDSASAHHAPKSSGLAINARDILRLGKLENERRVLVGGRPTIVFDVVSDPGAKTSSVEQKFVAAMEGTVSIDEATGSLQDVNTHGVRDVKVGGGMVANVHKGFALHILVAPQPDGVWLLKLAEGSGDARIGLFVHSGAHFRQDTEGCQLYDVSTTQSGDKAKDSALAGK